MRERGLRTGTARKSMREPAVDEEEKGPARVASGVSLSPRVAAAVSSAKVAMFRAGLGRDATT